MTWKLLAVLAIYFGAGLTKSQAQIVLQRTVIGASGGMSKSTNTHFSIQSAIGQSSLIDIKRQANLSLSQGFLQPARLKRTIVFENIEFGLYPNPAVDFVNFSFQKSPEGLVLKIYNLDGRVVFEHSLDDRLNPVIDLKLIPNGMYQILLEQNGIVVGTKKLIHL